MEKCMHPLLAGAASYPGCTKRRITAAIPIFSLIERSAVQHHIHDLVVRYKAHAASDDVTQ